jgi:hypothetical protein
MLTNKHSAWHVQTYLPGGSSLEGGKDRNAVKNQHSSLFQIQYRNRVAFLMLAGLKDAKISIDKCLEDRRVEADNKGSFERGRKGFRLL